MVHKLLSNLLKRYSRQRASIEALSAFVDLPIAFLLITNFEQPVLGIVAFAALRTNDISAQAAALAVVIRCNSKTGPATAGDQEHFRPDRLFFGGRTRRHSHILLQMLGPGMIRIRWPCIPHVHQPGSATPLFHRFSMDQP